VEAVNDESGTGGMPTYERAIRLTSAMAHDTADVQNVERQILKDCVLPPTLNPHVDSKVNHLLSSNKVQSTSECVMQTTKNRQVSL
jgi:hypothetical protein